MDAVYLFTTILLASGSAAIRKRIPDRQECHFAHGPALSGLPTAAPVAILNDVRSSVDCARRCKGNFRSTCSSYAYNRASRQCHLFPDSYTAVDGSHAGFKYYYGCPVPRVGLIGDPCEVDGHCTVANADCRDNICLCVFGYHYNPGPGTCVAVCPAGYGYGFYVVKDWALKGYNHEDHQGSYTVTQCKNWCRANSQCRSFDLNAGWCRLSYTTILEHPADSKFDDTNDYYQRDCA